MIVILTARNAATFAVALTAELDKANNQVVPYARPGERNHGTVINTHRLLDAPPVRDVLAQSDPDQTFLSVALSQRVFDDVLASGYTSLPPSRVVRRPIQVKEFTGVVYLYVPNPSGDLLQYGFGDGENRQEQARTVREPVQPSSVTNIMTGVRRGTAIQVGHLHGGLHGHPD